MDGPDSKRIRIEDTRREKESALRKQRDAIRADRDSIKANRNSIKLDRDEIKAEKDAIEVDREAIKTERERADRDAIKADRDAIKADRDILKAERDVIKANRDAIKLDRDAMKRAIDDLTLGKQAVEEKYNTLRSKLVERVECPVCFEVPTSGPVFACPNGHLVCSSCKGAECPACRSQMFGGKSLLAVTVIENIEHQCSFEGCGKLFPLDIFKNHLKSCPHRLVHCPANPDACNKEIELSKLYAHILQDCKGSVNNRGNNNTVVNNGKYPRQFSISIVGQGGPHPGVAFHWNGDVHMYLSIECLPAYTVFSVQHFGNAEECQKYVVTLAVHHPGDQALNGVNVHKWTSEPLPIEMKQEERRENGLLIGSKQLEKIGPKRENGVQAGITIIIRAKESCQNPIQSSSTSRPSAIVNSK